MLPLTPAEIVIALTCCLLLAIFIYAFRVLDLVGSLLAFTMGMIIWLYASVYWLVILISFMIFGFIATKFKYGYKKAMGVGEGDKGKRGGYNVLANALVPTIIAFMYGVYSFYNKESIFVRVASVVYLSAVSVGAADTFASEIGVLSNKVYWILDPRKKVEVGTDGGFSVLGQAAALCGAVLTTALGCYLFYTYPQAALDPNGTLGISLYTLLNIKFVIAISIIVGFAGCQIDSVLGATLQKRGYLTNSSVNHVAIGIGALLAMGVVLWIG